MKIKCDNCGTYFDKSLDHCPDCGAENPGKYPAMNKKPKTIAELKQWYKDHHLPPENVTRFYIGKNYTGKRAFGIYYDDLTGFYVVYKNKDNGQRAVRYQGTDEAKAVNELYLKLKSEILNQKSRSRNGLNRPKTSIWKIVVPIVSICAIIVGIVFAVNRFIPNRGYYHYNDTDYYYLNDWYYYDTYYNDWYRADSVDDTLSSNYRDYYDHDYYDYDSAYTDFTDTSYYEEWQESQDSDDSDYDWGGSDTWDSGGTDWSSDW